MSPQFVTVTALTAILLTYFSAPAASYSTDFDLTENPVNEDGKWVNGQSVGLQWSDVQTGAGNAYASQLVDNGGVCRYCDPIAHISASFMSFGASQYAQGTVYRVPGYENPSGGHEIELLLRFQITPNNAKGYEVLWSDDGWIVLVRWNGPVGNYTELASTGLYSVAKDGDLLRAEIGGDNRVRVYKNGALALTGPVDNTFPTGQPGIGFWPTPGAALASYGWKSFQAASLGSSAVQAPVPAPSRPVSVLPNPFSDWVALGIASGTAVTINDLQGRRVKAWEPKSRDRTIIWDGKDLFGKPVAGGCYLILQNTASGNRIRPLLKLQ